MSKSSPYISFHQGDLRFAVFDHSPMKEKMKTTTSNSIEDTRQTASLQNDLKRDVVFHFVSSVRYSRDKSFLRACKTHPRR